MGTLGSRKFGEFKIRTLLNSRARRPSVPEVSNAVSHVHRSLNNWVRASELDHLRQTIWAKASEPDAETPANWPPRFSSARPASQDSCGKSRTRCIIKSVAEIHLSKSLYFRHFGRGSKTIRTILRCSSIFLDIPRYSNERALRDVRLKSDRQNSEIQLQVAAENSQRASGKQRVPMGYQRSATSLVVG